MKEGIKEFLISHAKKNPVSFHMPGHKGSAIFRENGYGDFLDYIMDCDITEIPGADNLFQTEGIIAHTMERYRKLYETKKSYLLVNGSSSGIISAIMASVCRDGKLIMARNCHKSVFNALSLGRIQPIYARPEIIAEYGILGAVSSNEIARCLDENPDAEAVILPSPNYYGICSDIEKIAHEVHKRNKILIVDQAHGAHLKFFGKYGFDQLPKAAEEQGADIVINSIHKTLASWTQSALLNVCTDRVNQYKLQECLQMMESTSPSYPLMASLDINADLLEKKGSVIFEQWMDNLNFFYEEAGTFQGLVVMQTLTLDPTKINIDMSCYGMNGNQLEEYLNEAGIFPELVTGNIVMCMTGIGNKRVDFEKLQAVLKELSLNRPISTSEQPEQPPALTETLEHRPIPQEKVFVPLEKAGGMVCAASIIPYPPGIPIACPGEVLSDQVIEYVKERRMAKEKVMGVDETGKVLVGK